LARRKRSSARGNRASGARQESVPAPPAPSKENAARDTGRVESLSRKVILAVILLVFVIFEVAMILIFQSGDSITWKRELSEIDALYEEGSYEAAADRLSEFGEEWPGAKDTFDWNRKMGLYHARAGDWEKAARYYVRAAEINPDAPNVHARAGEAFYKTGKREQAIEHLVQEIESTHRAVGDHDRANYYLGLDLMNEGRFVEAFQHFQAISDREAWEEELEEVYQDVDEELLRPAREEAREMNVTDSTAAGETAGRGDRLETTQAP